MVGSIRIAACAVLVVSAACLPGTVEQCGNGSVCPQGTVCHEIADEEFRCVVPAQVAACRQKGDGEACSAASVPDGVCLSGLCLPPGCGNGVIDRAELCDDGNTTDGDDCSGDCLTDYQCGTGYVDSNEDCDDGNDADNDGCTSTCQQEHWVWRQLTPTTAPGARTRATMAFDAARGELVLFGGMNDSNDGATGTWRWSGTNWSEAVGPSPEVRFDHAMTYDTERDQVVLFGGRFSTTYFDDTWTWDGLQWTEITTAQNPGARHRHSVAFDEGRGQTLLYGGSSETATRYDDTWVFDGSEWSEMSPPASPEGRIRHRLVYDAARERVVMHGGDPTFGETWAFQDDSWQKLDISAPSRVGAAMVYHPPTQAIVLLAGFEPSGNPTSTVWSFDGATWEEQSAASGPSARGEAASAYYPPRRSIIFVGGAAGANVFDDTWELRLEALP